MFCSNCGCELIENANFCIRCGKASNYKNLNDITSNNIRPRHVNLVPATCPQCGANIKVDSNTDAAVCNYCGNAILVDRAIKKFYAVNNNTQNVHVVNNRQKQVINKKFINNRIYNQAKMDNEYTVEIERHKNQMQTERSEIGAFVKIIGIVLLALVIVILFA